MYSLSNKSIIISPKSTRISSKLKSILPVTFISLIGALIINFLFQKTSMQEKAVEESTFAFQAAPDLARASSDLAMNNQETFLFVFQSPAGIWFLSGALIAILLFVILNWRKL